MSTSDVLANTDIVVIGAGVSGLCSAWELRKRGFGVVVVEQRFPAYGASGRNPGALWLQTRRSGVELALAQHGKSKYEEYVDIVGDVFDYRTEGGLFFFETEEQGAVMESYVRDRRSAGLDIEMLDQAAATKTSSILPRTAIGAVFCADDAQVDSLQFVSAIESACIRAGVRVFRNTPVLTTLRDRDQAIGVRTVRGDVLASGVVWATGAWAKTLISEGIHVPIETVRIGQLMMQPVETGTTPLLHGPQGVHGSGALVELPDFAPEAFATPLSREGDGAYESYNDTAMLNRAGSLYVGHSIDGRGSLNPHISLASTNVMAALAADRYPAYADHGVTGLWAGLGSETPDQLPIVGRVDSVYLNVGHDWGVSSAPACAEVLAAIVAGEAHEFSAALAPDRASLHADSG